MGLSIYMPEIETLFLMHRVELKETNSVISIQIFHNVPNAPCGVERRALGKGKCLRKAVPNAPCGVESCIFLIPQRIKLRFLMHRVELKATKFISDTA